MDHCSMMALIISGIYQEVVYLGRTIFLALIFLCGLFIHISIVIVLLWKYKSKQFEIPSDLVIMAVMKNTKTKEFWQG